MFLTSSSVKPWASRKHQARPGKPRVSHSHGTDGRVEFGPDRVHLVFELLGGGAQAGDRGARGHVKLRMAS